MVDLEKTFIGIIRQYEKIIYKVCSAYISPEFPLADLYQDSRNSGMKVLFLPGYIG